MGKKKTSATGSRCFPSICTWHSVFPSVKRNSSQGVEPSSFSCAGSLSALPRQVLKLCDSIQHSFRNSFPITHMWRQMHCYPSSRANKYLMRHLKHYYVIKKKNKFIVKSKSVRLVFILFAA